jgi:hypothetical protein
MPATAAWEVSGRAAPGIEGLCLNCGWGTGGFKAIPAGGWWLAYLLATRQHHAISRPFDLDRFVTGRLIDEAAKGAARDIWYLQTCGTYFVMTRDTVSREVTDSRFLPQGKREKHRL